jgi:hypothetical protein
VNLAFLNRPTSVVFDDTLAYEVPFPFVVREKSAPKMSIESISADLGESTVTMTFDVSIDSCLKVNGPESEALCEAIIAGTLESPEGTLILKEWLGHYMIRSAVSAVYLEIQELIAERLFNAITVDGTPSSDQIALGPEGDTPLNFWN